MEKMNITNSLSAATAQQMAAASSKELQLLMEKFFNDIRAAAEGGETELPIPSRLHFPYRLQIDPYLKELGYRIGYHSNSRNQVVVSWADTPPDGWRDSEHLPF